VVQSAQDAIIVTDGTGTIISWNRAACTIFGYEEQEVIGRSLCLLMPERYREAHLMGLRRFLATGESYIMGRTAEFPGLRKDGREFPAEISLATWTTENGRYFSGILRDISERKQVEAFISRKEERLQHSQKMEVIGRFAAEVAHDFNHLLFIIMGSTQLLLKQLAPEDPSVKKLNEIGKAAERGQVLTQRLLNYSHTQPPRRQGVSLNTIVAEMTPLLERLVGKDIRIVANLAPGLGQVEADAGQIEQVLMNLAINARDAMTQGGVLTFHTANVEFGPGLVNERGKAVKPGSYARLAVSDTGIGMPPEVEAQCFAPFFTTKATGQGTGLGLSIVHGIIQRSGGMIDVQSLPGKGTTFLIDLPLVGSAGVQEPPVSAAKPARQGAKTVLVVDDSVDARMLTKEILEQDGYTVLEASSGEAALALAAEHPEPIDLLITDLMMPEMNGRELALRLTNQRPGMKVLYISAWDEHVAATYGVAGPGVVFLQKPFTPDTLSSKVQALLQVS
jgi:PAS domain S-box-containing protein